MEELIKSLEGPKGEGSKGPEVPIEVVCLSLWLKVGYESRN